MIYLARSLARKNHDVVVAGPGEAGNFDGVTYIQQNEELSKLVGQQWDAVIVSRWIEALNNPPWQTNALIFWTHDMPASPTELRCHRVVCLTEFHADAWKMPEDRVAIIGNGVDLSLFGGSDVARNENTVLWTANPERGLPVAARIWSEQILPRWPDLELHVYGRMSVYGWPPEMEGPYIPRQEHLENVFIHDPLTKQGLAKALRESWAWFYPTWWPETYCIAGLEAQAAGTPIVASPFGALNETVAGGVLTHDFPNAISQLRNKNRWEKLSEAGKEFASDKDWDTRADQWLELIEEIHNE